MTRDEMDILAAEYVLGTLDGEARRRVRARLSAEPDLRQAVRAWEERLSGLSAGEMPIAPSTGLWDRIKAGLDESGPPAQARTVRAGEGPWLAIAEGVDKKVLLVDRDQGFESFLLRFAPGARLAAHPHSMTEECLMLEGEVSIGDLHLSAGDYHVISAGTPHPEVSSRTGGLFYIRGELRAATG